MGSPPVIVDRPIPNRHLQMAFVERKQEVEPLATQATPRSFAHRLRLWGPQRRAQNPYTEIGPGVVYPAKRVAEIRAAMCGGAVTLAENRAGSCFCHLTRDAIPACRRPLPKQRLHFKRRRNWYDPWSWASNAWRA